ncbi:MAG TPA: 4-hydroxy-tetrahydrodipicolinate synthase [Candidatus Dormibacteraeota bacterium]|nr:4-hydroxy-tetrahydrodipicolinate synthase [Candidatus Dormibacteraeota bacterium]
MNARLMTAMVTPFASGGSIDLDEARRIARYLVARGNDGIVVAGSTGEGPTLTDDERLALFRAVKEAVPQATVVAATGDNNTAHSIELTRAAEATGVDAVMATVPAYNKPTQEGMIDHFLAIARVTDLPVLIYNIPGRTGTNLLPATFAALCERAPNVAGIKESTGDFNQFNHLVTSVPERVRIYCGDDYCFLPALAIGAYGCISVAGHLCASELRAMIEAYLSGDVARAASIHRSLVPLFDALFTVSNPIPVKWAMGELGFRVGECRPPLSALPSAAAQRLAPLLAPYQLSTATH